MKLPPNYLYVKMENDDRELLYQKWCKQAKLDPSLEYSIEEFFLTIDRIEVTDCD
jgi:hypothetical protein